MTYSPSLFYPQLAWSETTNQLSEHPLLQSLHLPRRQWPNFFELLDLVVITLGTPTCVLRDREHVRCDFLLMATPRGLGLVLPVEASTWF